jgi:hypothetical protein
MVTYVGHLKIFLRRNSAQLLGVCGFKGALGQTRTDRVGGRDDVLPRTHLRVVVDLHRQPGLPRQLVGVDTLKRAKRKDKEPLVEGY